MFRLHFEFPKRLFVSGAIFSLTLASLFAQSQQVNFLAGSGIGPFVADPSGTAANGVTLRIGTFNSASDTDVQALGYNLLWVNNQFTVMTPSAGNITTSSITSQDGSFSSDGSIDAYWSTSSASALSRQIWLVYSNNGTLSASTEFGVASSTLSDWDMPASYSSPVTKDLESLDIDITAFGSITGTSSTDSLRTAANPTTHLYWDTNGAGGLGGTGTWSASTADTEWTTAAGGASGDGPYAWGTTSGTDYYAGAGLNAYFGGTAGTVTVSGTVQAHDGLTIVSDSYSLTSGTINLAGSSPSANTINATTGTAIISAVLTGSNGLTKDGGGTLRLDATNTGLSGNITVNDGTLQANTANAVALSGSDRTTINSGGSLLITASNAVSGNLTLDGGTIAISGTTNDTVGALTLSSSSVIDLASLTGNLTFADSSAISWTGGLSIWNWNGTNLYGTSYGDNTRHVYFGNSSSGLSESQLNNISFYSDSGSSFIGNAFILSTGEIIAVPEPGVYATAALLLLGLAFQAYRRHPAVARQRR